MRHNKKGNHLGRTTSHKKALMRTMAAQLIEHKEIRTTVAKAKELRQYVERVITYGKKGSGHHRRLAFNFLQNKNAVTTLFDEIAPTFETRAGGYTRIIKLGKRKGDAASLSLFQLVGFEKGGEAKKAKTKSDKKEKAAKKSEEKEIPEKEINEKAVKESPKEEPVAEEIQPIEAETVKSEEQKGEETKSEEIATEEAPEEDAKDK